MRLKLHFEGGETQYVTGFHSETEALAEAGAWLRGTKEIILKENDSGEVLYALYPASRVTKITVET